MIFPSSRVRTALLAAAFSLAGWIHRARSEDAVFFRGINLNGPALEIDGRMWEGGNAPGLEVQGKEFENQAVALKPATDPKRARMIRSSIWGSHVQLSVGNVPPGDYQVFLHVWEDNHSEQFDILVGGKVVVEKFHSGQGGSWRRLGPWMTQPKEGKISVAAKGPGHGAANLSGIELWSGSGPVVEAADRAFATHPTPEQVEFFERKIRPVLADNCYECHGAGARNIKGGLLLDSRAGIVKGGDNGPVIAPGRPDASLLIQAVRHVDPDMAMPPKRRLPAQTVADLEAWVAMGAPDPRTDDTPTAARAKSKIDWEKARQWWSFRPLTSPAVPVVQDVTWPYGVVDAFILSRLEREGLKPADDADKRVLLRRATFDLTGLPPTPAEMEEFLSDPSPKAFDRVVDQLLASPRYGERWGRHWLDVARYADTAGDNSDFPIPQMHQYRDWVIEAFNRDLPYDQFVREQLAGDLMPGVTTRETHQRIIATGYIANARRFGSRVEDYPQHLTIEDAIDNLGRAFLGLTISCARCHDHKFDPVLASDYYALYGIFGSTRFPWPGIELEQKQRDLVPLVEPSELATADEIRVRFETQKREGAKEIQKLKDSLKELGAAEKKAVEARIQEAEARLRELVKTGLPYRLAYAVAEGRPQDAAIQLKGDPAKPGEVVPRRFLTLFGAEPLREPKASSGRLELAEWITDRRNPLTPRVMANRIWQHHFGKGLVPTPNDFGRQGKPPTHPELLDWLASEFVRGGWSIKSLHRTIMLSHTYRMNGTRSAEALVKDANNDLLASFPRRRLDAESIRDSLLMLSGNLDHSPAGKHPFPTEGDWKFTQHNPFKAVYESRRRSAYLMTQRIQRHPYLAIFDGADPSASTAARTTSVTPLQALFLLNDSFVHEQAAGFARRVGRSGSDDRVRIRFAYGNALGREPDSSEVSECLQFLERVRKAESGRAGPSEQRPAAEWTAMVRSLMRLNEFVYID